MEGVSIFMAYSDAQNKATQKYQRENMEIVSFRVRKGEREKLRSAAANKGQSIAQFMIHAVNNYAGLQVIAPAAGKKE